MTVTVTLEANTAGDRREEGEASRNVKLWANRRTLEGLWFGFERFWLFFLTQTVSK